MFRALIYPSSGACDCVDELPHRSSCSQFVVCWSFCCGWYLVLFVLQVEALLQPAKRTPPNTSRNKNSNTQRTENRTTEVVIHQHSRKLLKMDILMSETCWAHNKWNKITSDIKLVFHSSTRISVYLWTTMAEKFVNFLHSVRATSGTLLYIEIRSDSFIRLPHSYQFPLLILLLLPSNFKVFRSATFSQTPSNQFFFLWK